MHYTLGDYLLDIIQNSVEAGAARIVVSVVETGSEVRVGVSDDGAGMDETTRRRAVDPFYTNGVKHPGRTVGLGIPFLVQAVEAAGGRFDLDSAAGQGTDLRCSWPASHVDAPPFGELVSTFRQALCFDGDYEMEIERTRGRSAYRLRRSDLIDALGELATVGSQSLLEAYLESQEDSLEEEGGGEWPK